jgi:hypothetical protein
LAEGRPSEAGQLRELAGDAQERLQGFARRLDEGGIDGLLSDVGQFARRRPLVFLAGCAGAGFLLARVVRTTRSASGNGHDGYQPTLTSTRMPATGPVGAAPPREMSTAGASASLGAAAGGPSGSLRGDLE